MSSSEDDLIVTRRSLNTSNFPTSDEEEPEVGSGIPNKKVSNTDVEVIDFVSEPVSSNKSGSISSRKSILRSSRSSESENNETTVESRKSSPSEKSPRDKTSESSNFSQSSHHSIERSHSTQSQTSPTDQRKSLTSDSDEDVVMRRKSKKIFDSDEYESDGDKNESSQKILTNEEDANSWEEPPEGRTRKKKRIKKRLASSSDSNDESNTTSNIVENAYSEEKRDNESECPNLTTNEKRKKRLEKLNEKKRCELAKLVKEKKARNSKKDKNESSTHDVCEQPQPPAEESQNKPKKFLLLSDDDLSDNEGSEERLVHSDSENHEEETRTKSKKRKNVGGTKNNNSKKRKNGEENLDDAEDNSDTKKPKKPRSRASKSNATPKEPKESKRKSNKQKEAMLEIKSTTQKMIREGRISLPYHQPKQRSLDEFLQRRSDVPSIPFRISYDKLSLAGEHLMKREEEIAEFYKSESEHSEGEQITEDTEMSRQNNGETNAPESSAISCDNFSAEHDPPEVEASSNDEIKSLENIPSTERDVNVEEACNSPDSAPEELENGESNVSQVNALPNCDGQRTSEEPETVTISENTAAIDTDQSVLTVIKSDSVVNSTSNFSPKKRDSIPEEVDELLTKRDEVSEDTGDNIHEEVVDVADETSLSLREPDSVQEDEVRPSEDTDNCTLEQDTEDFHLEIEDSCPAETHVESGTNTSANPPLRVDRELMRRKRTLELLSSRNIRLPKLKKFDRDSFVEFEIDDLPKRIKSFMEKFASHFNAKNKTKKQSTKMNVTNVQTDSQGEIIDVIKETLTLKSHEDDDNDVEDKFKVPGSKHSFLKQTILKTLISKKTLNWEKYQDEKYSLFDGDDRNYGDTNENKEEEDTDEPNFDPYHPEDEPDDEDLVEDDVDMTEEQTKKKNKFVDEEAEVDYDEDENIVEGYDEEADSEGECSADDEEESQTENEGENSEDESETDAKNNPRDDDDDGEKIDSDEELLNNFLKTQEGKKSPTKETRGPSKLFKNNTTGEDLENKVLRLESGSQVDDFTNTQIFSVCSGKFATQIVPPVSNDTSQFLTDSQFPDDSQGFNLSMQETNDGFQSKGDVTSNSAVNKSSFLLSDDESDTEELFNKKRKALQLEDSDNDESAKSIDGEEGEDPENEDNPDDVDAVEEEQEEDELDGELGYNSEEEIISYKDTKPTEFFENEAELSESEWGSEDENEKDLDYFEKEAGDDEDIDNDRLKEELGRIHMRHLMDDDQKNVRLLQEILLEDGELHADGQRNRKFQWKNLDGGSFVKNFFGDSDDENALIDDNDMNSDGKSKNWRQMRHEREKFLSKQEKNNDLLLSADDEGTSFVRIASAAKVITKSTVPDEPIKPAPHKSPNAKFSLHTKLKCGSFLSRGQQLLSRLANNVVESKESKIQGAKNSRNFVFAAKSVEEVVQKPATAENQAEKRKISSKSVMARKKLKLINGASNQAAPLKSGILAQLSSLD